MAGFVGVFAGFVARHAFEHAQLAAGVQALQGVERELAAGGFGGEVKNLVGALRGRGLERGEERGHGFADAGGRLRHQDALARFGAALRAVNGFGQEALTGPEIGEGEG